MLDITLIVYGLVLVFLAGSNLRSFGNGVIFSVNAMGAHADVRKMGLNGLVYWLGTVFVMGPAIGLFWYITEQFIANGGSKLQVYEFAVSALLMTWSLLNLYIFKKSQNGVIAKATKQRFQKKIIKLSRESRVVEKDFLFGVLNGISVTSSELGLLIGGVLLIQLSGVAGVPVFVVALIGASSLIWFIYLVMLYGLNLGGVERFRKNHASKIGLACGSAGVIGAWLILANSMNLL